jgi:hypothetical protein
MSIKLTKKYRKNNRRSTSKRGGGPCTPEKFGRFPLTRWGNIGGFGGGGCGFNIYVTKNSNFTDSILKELWVDIDETGKITKIAQGVKIVELKTPTGGGISSEKLKNPEVLLDIFPQGFYMYNKLRDGTLRLNSYILEKEQLTGEKPQPPYPDLYDEKAKEAFAKKFAPASSSSSAPSSSSESSSSSSAPSSSESSSSNMSGLAAVWEVQTNPKYKNNALAKLRDPTIPFATRQKEKERFINLFGNNPDCTNVQFGEFKVNRWGGNPTGGCGFNIWDHTGKKFWIDVDTFFNIASVNMDVKPSM